MIEMKDVKGFEGLYAMTLDGQVWGYKRQIFRKPFVNGNGYLCIDLWKNGKRYNKRINILMAETWDLPKPDWWAPGMEKLDVAHLDDNPKNNNLDNLFWKTRSENLDTDHWREGQKNRRRTPVRCVETGEVFPTQRAAGRAIGKNYYGINNCLMGKQRTCGGYHWERVEEEEEI